MTAISLNQFGGIAPVQDRSKLLVPHAQSAINCLFEGGNLRAMRAPVAMAISYAFQSSVVQSIFRLSDLQWIRWPGDVAAARGPSQITTAYLGLGDDYRIYFAGTTGDSPEWPRWTTRFRAMSNANPATFFDAPTHTYPLGVPPPQSVPTVVISTVNPPGVGAISELKKGNPVEVVPVVATTLTNGNRILVSVPTLVSPANGSELHNNQYAISLTTGNNFKLDSADGSEWTADISLFGAGSFKRVYADSELTDRIYVYTYVNEFGEEGPPSLASAPIGVGDGQGVIVGMDTNPAITIGSGPVFNVTKKRIYRSVSGSTELNYQFVAEVLIDIGTYTDTIDTGALGEILPTEGYDLPPATLRGLILHPNGFLVGFVGNKLHVSEPYLPYAWPADYVQTLESEIVALEIFGSTIVVLTKAQPYLAPATDPASISPRFADFVYPCVSRQACVSTGYSVVYVSPAGLISFDGSGPRNLTENYFSEVAWKALIGLGVGNAVTLEYQDGKIWMLARSDTDAYNAGTLYAFDMANPAQMDITTHPVVGTTMFVNRAANALFVMYGDTVVEATRRLYRFNGDTGTASVYEWNSKRALLRKEISFGWLQVFATDFASITVHISCEVEDVGTTTQTFVVANNKPIRLASGYLSAEWTVRIVGTSDIQAVHVSESMEELREIEL